MWRTIWLWFSKHGRFTPKYFPPFSEKPRCRSRKNEVLALQTWQISCACHKKHSSKNGHGTQARTHLRKRGLRLRFLRDFLRKRKIEELLRCKDHQISQTHTGDHLEPTPGLTQLNYYRKNPKCEHIVWGNIPVISHYCNIKLSLWLNHHMFIHIPIALTELRGIPGSFETEGRGGSDLRVQTLWQVPQQGPRIGREIRWFIDTLKNDRFPRRQPS